MLTNRRREFEQKIEIPLVPAHLIQIKASGEELNSRIKKFMERKREEINVANIRDFCRRSDTQNCDDFSCARIDSVLIKQKDSKGHLQVSKVYNTYHRDQNNQDYMLKYMPSNGVEERLVNLETQLNLYTSTPKSVYKRLKLLEDRLLYLESVSPEYIQFWDKSPAITRTSKKKKEFSVAEIDEMIMEFEKKRTKLK